MKWIVAAALAASLPIVAQAATPSPVPPAVVMPTLAADAKPRPVTFSRIVSSIPLGTAWATFQRSFGCAPLTPTVKQLTWSTTDGNFNNRIYGPLVAKTFKDAGLAPGNDPDELFKTTRPDSDLKLAGNVKMIEANLCLYAPLILPQGYTWKPGMDTATGYVLFDIEWQLFSASQDKVVLKKEIKTGVALPQHAQGNYPKLIEGAVAENVRALIASDDFRAIVLAPAEKPAISARVEQTALPLQGASGAKAMKISDAVGSVVLILTGDGHGSGFLVSSDGYLMTAQHVVGGDKYVKIRWSDGLEGVGEVVRTDKRRDVALIKTDPRGRQPLGLRRASPQPGDTVFAIGAPLDVKNQSTVTRGVASANRIMDGFSFIQSDVTVSPGNSGGPLLDEQGEVVGICDLSYRPSSNKDIPTGINYFVPVDDALRFLSAEPR